MSLHLKKNRASIPENSVTRKILDSLAEPEEEHSTEGGNQELWLVSYADLMTLLFGFFVMLYSDSSGLDRIKEALNESTPSIPASTPAPAPQVTPEPAQTPSARELALEQKVQLLEKQIAREGRLLSRTPCRLCTLFAPVPSPLQSVLGGTDSDVMILHLTRGGPADLAGLRSGDVIESIDGQDPKDPDLFRKFPIGKEILIRYRRLGVRNEARVVLDQTSEEARKLAESEPASPPVQLASGLKVARIGLRERIIRYIPSDIEGLLVLESCLGCTDPMKDEVIVSANGRPVETPDQLTNPGETPLFLEIWNPNSRSYRLIRAPR
jgi:flagellar motor protein MotB